MPRKKAVKAEDAVSVDTTTMVKYEVKERKYNNDTIYTIVQGKTLVAVLDGGLDNALGVASGICLALNSQDKYILPTTKNYGGGFVRKLTKEEQKRQDDLVSEAWGLKG